MARSPFINRHSSFDSRDSIILVLIITLVTMILMTLVSSANPKVETVEVEVPGPTVTVEVPGDTIEVPVTPEACLNALDIAQTIMFADNALILSILEAYADYPDENLQEFGIRVQDILFADDGVANLDMQTYVEQAQACYNASTTTTSEEAQGA